MAKKYDLVVSVGEYRDSQGNTKKRWKNIGAVMSGKEGNHYILLDRTFNPAGVVDPEGRDQLLISCMAPKDTKLDWGNKPQAQQKKESVGFADLDNDLPF